MKRLATIALLFAFTAAAASAQRGGGFHGSGGGAFHGGGGFHGGSVGHGGPAFHSGFSAPHFSGSHFSGPRFSSRYAPGRSYRPYASRSYRPYAGSQQSRFSRSYRRSGFRAPYRRPRDFDHRFRRRFFPEPVFFPAIPDWIGLGPMGCYAGVDAQVYGGDYGCEDMSADSDEPQVYGGDDPNSTPAPPPDYDQQTSPQDYQPSPQPDYRQPRTTALPATQTATTIVFNDGRPSVQIHNYALTPTTLYVLDEKRSDIPLDQINLAATQQANRAAGLDFQIPSSHPATIVPQ